MIGTDAPMGAVTIFAIGGAVAALCCSPQASDDTMERAWLVFVAALLLYIARDEFVLLRELGRTRGALGHGRRIFAPSWLTGMEANQLLETEEAAGARRRVTPRVQKYAHVCKPFLCWRLTFPDRVGSSGEASTR